MKHSSILFALILIASASLLSAGKSASAASKNPRPNQHEKYATKLPNSIQEQQEKEFLSALESSQAAFLEALRTIERDARAEREETHPQPETYSSPSVRVQVGLLVVGVVYSLLAWLQWSAIGRQADIAERTLMQLERAWIVVDIEATAYLVHNFYMISFKYGKRNVGRSPAWLTGGMEKSFRLDGPNESLPETPDYKGDLPHPQIPVGPNQIYNPPMYEQRIVLKEDDWVRYGLGEIKLGMYGIAHYRDSIDIRETRFCVFLAQPIDMPVEGKPGKLLCYLAGPSEYNTTHTFT